MSEVERDNDENDEYVYFVMYRAPTRSRGCNRGWGWEVDGV